MKQQLAGMTTRPHLFIQTQFYSQSESQHNNNIQFQKESSKQQKTNHLYYQKQIMEHKNQGNSQNNIKYYNNTIEGIVLLEHIIGSWQINTLYNCFQKLKSLNQFSLKSFHYERSFSKKLLPNKSLTNLRQNNHLFIRHQQQTRLTHSNQNQRHLERAQVINQIISKLNSREKSMKQSKSKSHNKNKSLSKKEIIKQKLKNLSSMLKSCKNQNKESNVQSTVYYTKHSNNTKVNRIEQLKNKIFQTKNKQQYTSNLGSGMYKRLKQQIKQVKSQVNQLKNTNDIYRRQNEYLRLSREKQHINLQKRQFRNIIIDQDVRPNTFNHFNTQRQQINYNSSLPYLICTPVIMNNPYVIPPVQYLQKSYQSHNYQRQNSRNLNQPIRKNNPIYYQNSYVSENFKKNQIKEQSSPICFQCGCKNNNTNNIKSYSSSPHNNLF